MGSILFGIVVLFIYLLPSFVGYNKKNANSIFLLNAFLGWTFLGWVIAMVWAVAKDESVKPIITTNFKNTKAEEILQFKKLYDDGIIDDEQFEVQKKRLLNK